MSDNIRADTDLLMRIVAAIRECRGDTAKARARITAAANDYLQVAGVTELGKSYAEGIRPGTFATLALLTMILELLDDTAANTHTLSLAFDNVVDMTIDVANRGGSLGGGGRR